MHFSVNGTVVATPELSVGLGGYTEAVRFAILTSRNVVSRVLTADISVVVESSLQQLGGCDEA